MNMWLLVRGCIFEDILVIILVQHVTPIKIYNPTLIQMQFQKKEGYRIYHGYLFYDYTDSVALNEHFTSMLIR